jgi:hypothetical protein
VIASPQRGTAAELYTGIYGSVGADDTARINEQAARRERTAWRVDLAGLAARYSCPTSSCPRVAQTEELIIDEQTGTLLYVISPIP